MLEPVHGLGQCVGDPNYLGRLILEVPYKVGPF